jgi:hypothetical protein
VVGSELIQKYLVIELDDRENLFMIHFRVMDQNLFVNYFELLKNMLQRLFLLMKLMRLEQNGIFLNLLRLSMLNFLIYLVMNQIQVVNEKFNERC